MNFETLKREYIKALLDTNAVLIRGIDETPFTLRSGKTSYMFLDHSRVGAYPKAYRAFIDVMAGLVQDLFGTEQPITLCNVDSKISAQMVGSLAYILQYPQIIYKSHSLTKIEKGTNTAITGNYDFDGQIAIIDDVASGGDGTAKQVADEIKKLFPRAVDIRIFVGCVKEITPSTYSTHHAVTRAELVQLAWKSLNHKQQQAIEQEMGAF